jgi:hypothetical protein
MTQPRVAVIDLDGPPRLRGLQHGRLAAPAIRAFLDDGLARLDAFLPEPPTLAQFESELASYGSSIAEQTPELFEEIAGLAEGAGISITQALLLQARRELAGFSRFTTAGDCTTFARARRKPLLGQTIDLAGDMEDQICLLRIRDQDSGHRSLVLSFTGLVGYLGVNDRGLAVGLNLVLGGRWRPGLPPYLAIRDLLDCCASVADALQRLAAFDLASSRCFMLCDRSEAAFVENLDNRRAVRRGELVVHTNHFLDAGLSDCDEINPFAKNSSRKRLNACLGWLSSHRDDLEPAAYFDLFTTPPICVPDYDDRRVEKTVATVVLDPLDGVILLRAGDPRHGRTERFGMLAA